MLYFLDIFGTAIFAITGSLAARRKHLDIFGVIVLGLATAVGGGTFRDIILGVEVFWVGDNIYIIVAALASILTFLLVRIWDRLSNVLVVFDSFGLAVFTIVGLTKALMLGYSDVVAVTMGIMTGVLGGMIRDILSGQVPLVLRREIYATASFAGALFFVLADGFVGNYNLRMVLAMLIILTVRLLAIKYNLALPRIGRPDRNDE